MIVSNTEVTMSNTCERQHYYRFGLDIEPKFANLGPALVRGLIGHEALDSFYLQKQSGAEHDDCVQAAWDTINKKIRWLVEEWPDDVDLIKVIAKLKLLLEGYFRVYRKDNFRVLEVEKFFSTPITDSHSYGMRLDLLIEFTAGEFRGDLAVFDHKFVYNFKTQKELTMDGQLSKYVKTLREQGYVVTKGVFNQIRYRELRDPTDADLYQRTTVKSPKTKTDRIWAEQRKATERLAKRKALPLSEWSEEAIRNLSPFTCKYCHFQPLCDGELLGHDISTELVANYQPNTYGYTDLIVADA